jgi:hypothetical protein
MDTRPLTTASGIGRRGLLTVGAGAALAIATLTQPMAASAAAKTAWRSCPKCPGLFAGKGTRAVGVCPAGGSHKPVTSYNYLPLSGLSVTNPDLYKNWFPCKKCRGLFYDHPKNPSVCPKGGTHARTGPAYDLWAGTSLPFMETDWHECLKCSGLYWARNSNGVCPDGGEHQPGGHNYTLLLLR